MFSDQKSKKSFSDGGVKIGIDDREREYVMSRQAIQNASIKSKKTEGVHVSWEFSPEWSMAMGGLVSAGLALAGYANFGWNESPGWAGVYLALILGMLVGRGLGHCPELAGKLTGLVISVILLPLWTISIIYCGFILAGAICLNIVVLIICYFFVSLGLSLLIAVPEYFFFLDLAPLYDLVLILSVPVAVYCQRKYMKYLDERC